MIKKEISNRFGMTVIEKYAVVPISSLKFNQDYQRIKDLARIKKIKESMTECNQFLPDKCLTVNQDNEIVDGQHRCWAAQEMGWKTIPITKYYFDSKKNEAAFFVHINGFDQRLKIYDYWYGLYLSGDEVASFLYLLEDSSMSALKENIAVKGKFTENSKWTIGQVLQVICFAISGRSDVHWKKAEHETMKQKLKIIGKGVALDRVNEFAYWMISVFGEKKNNALAYYSDPFRAILFFYSLLKRNGWHNDKGTIAKMKQFKIDQNFMTAPGIGKKHLLVNHFNSKRKKDTIEYSAIK